MSRAIVGRVLLGGAILLAGWWLLNSPVLAFGGVQVAGYEGDDRAQLEVALKSAADEGNLFMIPRDEIRSVAARFPEVGDVAVTRSWPRSIRIDVIPARPVAALVSSKGRSVVVSSRGRVIGPAPKRHTLPRLLLSEAPPKAGSPVPREATAAFAFIRELEPEFAARIRALHLGETGRVEGRLTRSGALIVGPPGRPAARATALTAILKDLSDEDQAEASYVDLSVPERPAVGFGTPPADYGGTATKPQASTQDSDTTG